MKWSFCLCQICEHVRKPRGVSDTKYPCPVLICNLHNDKMTKPKLSPINTRLVRRKINRSHQKPQWWDHISRDMFCSLSLVFVTHYRVTPPILILIMSRRITHHTPVTSHVTPSSHNGEQVTGMTQPKYDLSYLYQWYRGINPQYLTTCTLFDLVWMEK